jgi:ABC-type xylose transport system permease subunit
MAILLLIWRGICLTVFDRACVAPYPFHRYSLGHRQAPCGARPAVGTVGAQPDGIAFFGFARSDHPVFL